MTLRRACLIGGLLGVTFSAGAMIADLIATYRRPPTHVFYNPADFLATLQKGTP